MSLLLVPCLHFTQFNCVIFGYRIFVCFSFSIFLSFSFFLAYEKWTFQLFSWPHGRHIPVAFWHFFSLFLFKFLFLSVNFWAFSCFQYNTGSFCTTKETKKKNTEFLIRYGTIAKNVTMSTCRPHSLSTFIWIKTRAMNGLKSMRTRARPHSLSKVNGQQNSIE